MAKGFGIGIGVGIGGRGFLYISTEYRRWEMQIKSFSSGTEKVLSN